MICSSSYYEMFFIAKGKKCKWCGWTREIKEIQSGGGSRRNIMHMKRTTDEVVTDILPWRWLRSASRQRNTSVSHHYYKQSPLHRSTQLREANKKEKKAWCKDSQQWRSSSSLTFLLLISISHSRCFASGLCVYSCSLAGGSLSNPWSPNREFVYLCVCTCAC